MPVNKSMMESMKKQYGGTVAAINAEVVHDVNGDESAVVYMRINVSYRLGL